MAQILYSLVISNDTMLQRELEDIMSIKADSYHHVFVTYHLDKLAEVDREPDLIFLDDRDGAFILEDVDPVFQKFPGKIYVLVTGRNTPETRRQFMRRGVDELMSLADMNSDLGRHFIEKLISFKDLAEAEKRAEASEERFRGIIENALDVITLIDPDGTVVYNSPSFPRQLGYESWEVLGQTFSDFLHEDDRDYFLREIKKLVSGAPNKADPLEFRFRHKDGRWRVFEAMVSNLLENELVRAVVLNSRDVTEQKIVEDELEKYRSHLEDLVEKRTREAEEANKRADTVMTASPDALLALDEQGVIIFVSRHYHFAYPDSAPLLVPGQHIIPVYHAVMAEIGMTPNDPEYDELFQWWSAPKGSKEVRLPSGTWLRLQARKIRGTNSVVVSTTNITNYKRQQALLAAQSAELSLALEKEKMVVEQQKTFVSMVSHEFRTPLTIIDGNAQIIEKRGRELEPEALKKRAVTIREGVERLVRLIETILSAHMLESGKLSITREPCDLTQIIKDVCAEQQDVAPNHKIVVKIDCPIPVMPLDGKVMRQMMTNLLSNAIKYSPKSKLVEVDVWDETDHVVIEVKDNGVGIPENELPKIFSKYFRASTSGGIPGSGLGLNLVKQFIELHGGTVGLSSTVGKGSTFTVNIPKQF